MRRRYLLLLVLSLPALALAVVLPALATNQPATVAVHLQGQPTGACSGPAQRAVDGTGGMGCPQPTRLPLPPATPAPARGRVEPPARGVCVTLPGRPCPRPPIGLS
jgi:hypothetical protein